jgi:hypothetical protein
MSSQRQKRHNRLKEEHTVTSSTHDADGRRATFSVAVYTLIACTWTWLCWIPTLVSATHRGLIMPPTFLGLLVEGAYTGSDALLVWVFQLGVYGPLIAAVVTAALLEGPDTLHAIWARSTRLRAGVGWYAAALLIPVAIYLPSLLIGAPPLEVPGPALLIPFILYQMLTSGLEEPGWRGFALPLLQRERSAESASWWLGLIWAVWHYPLLVYLYMPIGLVPMVFSVAGFTLGTIGQTIILTWLFNNTRSAWLAIVFHTALNVAATYLLGATDNPLLALAPALVTWLIAAVLLRVYGSETLMGREAAAKAPAEADVAEG